MLSNTRIVLFEPHYPGNVGSVARVMHNFGLKQLFLVNPLADHLSPEARRLATHGEHLLDQAVRCQTLQEALTDCGYVLCTSASIDGFQRSHHYGRPDELLAKFVPTLAVGNSALVFGPEPSGLSNHEIAQCHGIIRIITAPEFTSLNLAQAVTICCYELHRQGMHAIGSAMVPTQKIAPYEQQERMFQELRSSLELIHFLYGTKADPLMAAIRHLIGRAHPSPNEVRILHGLARQLRYIMENGGQLPTTNDNDEDSAT
ncbi:MAG: RNA methyltransferase [Zavarzinella sp.]